MKAQNGINKRVMADLIRRHSQFFLGLDTVGTPKVKLVFAITFEQIY